MSGARLGGCALAAFIGMIPAVAFAGAFGRTPAEALSDPRYALPVAGAALVTAVVCLLVAATTRLPPVTRCTFGAAVLAAYLVLAVPSNVFSGPYRLLTAVPPLDPAGAELATVALLAGLSTLAAIEPVLRGRSAAWAMPVALLSTTAGLAVSAPAGVVSWLAPVTVSALAVLLALGARSRRADARLLDLTGRRSRLLGAAVLPAILTVAVAAGLLGPAVLAASGGTRPLNARDLLSQPVRPRQVTSPLAQFPALHASKVRVRLNVTTGWPLRRLRYATLTGFDGTYWTSLETYWRAGTRLPAFEAGTLAETVEERVRGGDAGPVGMLVASGRPVQVSVGGLGVGRDTGDVVFPDDRPTLSEYTVCSVVPVVDRAGLERDEPAPDPSHDNDDAADAAAGFAAPARKIAGTGRGYAALRRLADHFARQGGFTRGLLAQGAERPRSLSDLPPVRNPPGYGRAVRLGVCRDGPVAGI